MLLSNFLTGRGWTRCSRVRSGSRLCLTAAAAIVLPLLSATCVAADTNSSLAGGRWSGLVPVLVLVILIGIILWSRARSARKELARLREHANHCEYERNLAQQELVKRLEEERELAKEKMQFESQLTEYEKYASLAQLALGAAHEINNPLLGILSHLELERRDADDECREEIDQCIEGAKRISLAVRGLLDYARPVR